MIHNVAILGAGALGAAYATRFASQPRFKTFFIARGTRAEILKHHGIVVNGKRYNIPVEAPINPHLQADLIIVALKHHHLSDALPDLGPFVHEQTTILSVMNGLDSETIIGARYGMDKVVYAIAVGIDALREDNQVHFTKIGKIFFGEAQNATLSPRVAAIRDAFDAAGIGWEIPEDMVRSLWWKFMVNVGMNQASAVTGLPYGAFQTSAEAQALMESLMMEVITLASHAGVNLVEQDVANWYTFLNTLSPEGKTSMLQDIEARRKTEVDIFGGKVIQLGQQYHVPTPVNQTVVRIIRLLEQSYAI